MLHNSVTLSDKSVALVTANLGLQLGMAVPAWADSGTLAASPISVNEPAGAASDAVFTVTLNRTGSELVTVDYATGDPADTAAPGRDYLATSGTLNFGTAGTSRTVRVPVLGDGIDEPDETFTLKLSGALNATPTELAAVATIKDGDATPRISIGDVAVTEGNSGTTDANFPVALSAPSAQTVTVAWNTANGTGATRAEAPDDYTAASDTLTFNPGEQLKTVTVPVAGETVDEDTETFTATLENPTNAVLVKATGSATIADDAFGDATYLGSTGDIRLNKPVVGMALL